MPAVYQFKDVTHSEFIDMRRQLGVVSIVNDIYDQGVATFSLWREDQAPKSWALYKFGVSPAKREYTDKQITEKTEILLKYVTKCESIAIFDAEESEIKGIRVETANIRQVIKDLVELIPLDSDL